MKKAKHPLQPLVIDDHSVIRFKANAIVRFLLEEGPFDMNDLAKQGFSRQDREQFAQLIGYSLSGAGDLSYVSDKTYNKATRKAKPLVEKLVNKAKENA
jgi:hypothetical protein